MKKLLLLLVAVVLTLCPACSNSALENIKKEAMDTMANASDSDNKYVQMVKGGYREDNPDLTYDETFSAFFGTPRWKYLKGDEGQDVVEFTGDCTYQDVAVKARIQFVVDEENGTFEATYLAFNEVPQNALTLAALITKAFESKDVEPVYSNNDNRSNSSGNNNNDYPNEVLYNSVPVHSFLGINIYEFIESLGLSSDDESFNRFSDDNGYYFPDINFNLPIFSVYYDANNVNEINFQGMDAIEFNGITFDKTRIEIIEVLGNPVDEGEAGDQYEYVGSYFMRYDFGEYGILILLYSPNDIPYSVSVSLPYTGDLGDDYYADGFGDDYNGEYNSAGFRRSDYFTGVTPEDLLRYPDQYMYSNVLFSRWKVSEVIEPKLYFMVLESNPGWFIGMSGTRQYMIFDDRINSGANALVNDTVTIYGKFNGNEIVSMTDGQNIQVPYIVADMMIMNNTAPSDTNSFTNAFIDSLNAWHDTYVSENQYVSNQSVKIACKLGADGVFAPYHDSRSYTGDSREPFYVDGYWIYEFITKYDGAIIDRWYNTESLSADILTGNLYWMNGTISLDIEYLLGALRSVTITFDIDTIEQY